MVIILSTTFVKASYLEHCADHALVPSVIYIYIYMYIYIYVYIYQEEEVSWMSHYVWVLLHI